MLRFLLRFNTTCVMKFDKSYDADNTYNSLVLSAENKWMKERKKFHVGGAIDADLHVVQCI